MESLKDYFTVRQVSKTVGLSEYRIRQLIREKQIRATKIGQWRVRPEDLEEFVRKRSNM
jgi:excisionase family DNA binding protein